MYSRLLVAWLALALFGCAGKPAAPQDDSCFYANCRYSKETVTGSSYPSDSDRNNLNAASIPTEPTPWQFEYVGTSAGHFAGGKPDHNFSVSKGFYRFGSAISENNGNTFYNFNEYQALQGMNRDAIPQYVYPADSIVRSRNVGAAFALFLNALKRFTIPTFGLQLRPGSGKVNLGYGVSFNSKHFSLGHSMHRMESSRVPMRPGHTITTFAAGLRVPGFHAEYTALLYRTTNRSISNLSMFNKPVQILTLSGHLKRASISVARRSAYNFLNAEIILYLISLGIHLSDFLSVSYFHNYVPGTDSLGLQLFF